MPFCGGTTPTPAGRRRSAHRSDNRSLKAISGKSVLRCRTSPDRLKNIRTAADPGGLERTAAALRFPGTVMEGTAWRQEKSCRLFAFSGAVAAIVGQDGNSIGIPRRDRQSSQQKTCCQHHDLNFSVHVHLLPFVCHSLY